MPFAALSARYAYHAVVCLQFTLFFCLRPYIHAIVKRMKQKKYGFPSDFKFRITRNDADVCPFPPRCRKAGRISIFCAASRKMPSEACPVPPHMQKSPEALLLPGSCPEKNKCLQMAPSIRNDARNRHDTDYRNRIPAVFRRCRPAAHPSHWQNRKRKRPACPSDAWHSKVPCPCPRQ